MQAFATAAIAVFEPVRVSPGRPPPKPPPRAPLPAAAPVAPALASPTTQRILPKLTSIASHETLTSLSRPENPPIPATLASLEMIAVAALD